MKLYSAWYCPFAQRTWMALKHKGIDFDYVEIDPYDKTDEWMLLSRGAGQVPVISIKNPVGNSGNGGADFTLPDSNRTMEYIETAYRSTGPNLYGNTPIETADIKYWQDYMGGKIIPYFYRLLKAPVGSEALEEARSMLEAGLTKLTDAMDAAGPYFSGDTVNAVDISLAPFMLRTKILLPHYKTYDLPSNGATWQRLNKWWQAMADFGPLKDTSTGIEGFEERIIETYAVYADGGGQKDVENVS